LTFAQFEALAKRYADREEMLDYRTGLVCAVLANLYRKKGKRPFKPQDFMPKGRKPKRKQTPEEMLAVFDNLRGSNEV